MGCKIAHCKERDIKKNVDLYVHGIEVITIDRKGRKKREDKATEKEHDIYRRQSGDIIWEGNVCVPQEYLTDSHLQQLAPRLRDVDMTRKHRVLYEMENLSANILFKKLTSRI